MTDLQWIQQIQFFSAMYLFTISLIDDNKEQAGFVVANKTFLWIRDAPAP